MQVLLHLNASVTFLGPASMLIDDRWDKRRTVIGIGFVRVNRVRDDVLNGHFLEQIESTARRVTTCSEADAYFVDVALDAFVSEHFATIDK